MFHVMLGNQVIHAAAKDDRSEERFSRNAETDIVCRLLLEKKKNTTIPLSLPDAHPLPSSHLRPAVRGAAHDARRGARHGDREGTHRLGGRLLCFFFNDTATTEIYTLSLHDALPISYEKLKCCRTSGAAGSPRPHTPGC